MRLHIITNLWGESLSEWWWWSAVKNFSTKDPTESM